MQSAMVPDQTQAGQGGPGATATPTQAAGVPGLTDAGAAADKAGSTRQPDEGQRSAEGRTAALLQPAEGPCSAQVADAGGQAGPSGQAPAQATGVDQDCASILQRAEAENAREAEATVQMVADMARRARPAVVQALEVMAQPLVTALAEAAVQANLQAAAAARMERAGRGQGCSRGSSGGHVLLQAAFVLDPDCNSMLQAGPPEAWADLLVDH